MSVKNLPILGTTDAAPLHLCIWGHVHHIWGQVSHFNIVSNMHSFFPVRFVLAESHYEPAYASRMSHREALRKSAVACRCLFAKKSRHKDLAAISFPQFRKRSGALRKKVVERAIGQERRAGKWGLVSVKIALRDFQGL